MGRKIKKVIMIAAFGMVTRESRLLIYYKEM